MAYTLRQTGVIAILVWDSLRIHCNVCKRVGAFGMLCMLWGLMGCDNPQVTPYDELAAFNMAGPVRPQLDMSKLRDVQRRKGPYRVGIGDVLELTMPAILQVSNAELPRWSGKDQPYLTRVNFEGDILVPIVGALSAAGKTLAQIEEDIVAAYYPRYVKTPPAVVGKIAEYRTRRVMILGAVDQPGYYDLNQDEMSVVGLLMKAGGIGEDGAAAIRIERSDGGDIRKPIILPVKGMDIPFADVALHEGDKVIVDRLDPQVFTVIGLVNGCGAFSYPSGTRYNLLQALAIAGGINPLADPQYAKIYRQDADGRIISAVFKITDAGVPQGASVYIKPGDVVSVEQTFYTKTRLLIAEIFRINAGVGMIYKLNDDDD